jgi:hypothetical protein
MLAPFGWSWAASARVDAGAGSRNSAVATAIGNTRGADATPVKDGDSRGLWSRITGKSASSAKRDPFLEDATVQRALKSPSPEGDPVSKNPPTSKKPVTTDAAKIARSTPTSIAEPKPKGVTTSRAIAPSRGEAVSMRSTTRPVEGPRKALPETAEDDAGVADIARSGRVRTIPESRSIPRDTSVASGRGTVRSTAKEPEGTDQAGQTSSRIARVSGVEPTEKAVAALDEALRLRAEQLIFRAKEAERQDRLTDALTLAEAAARIESKNPELFDRSDSPRAYLEALEEHCRIAWESRGTAPSSKPEGPVAKPAARNLVAREQPARRPTNAPREETATASLARKRANASESSAPTTEKRPIATASAETQGARAESVPDEVAPPSRPGKTRLIPDESGAGTRVASATPRRNAPQVADADTPRPAAKPAAVKTATAKPAAVKTATGKPNLAKATAPRSSHIEPTNGEALAPATREERTAMLRKPAATPARDEADIPVTRRRLDPSLASNLSRAGEAASAHPTDVPKRRKPAIPDKDGFEEARSPKVASADHQLSADEAITQDARDRNGSAAALAKAVAAQSDLGQPGRARVGSEGGAVADAYRGPVIRPMTAARVDDPPSTSPESAPAAATAAPLKPVPEAATLPAPGAGTPSIPVLATPGSDGNPPPSAPAAPPSPPAPSPVELAAVTAPALTAPPSLTPPTPAPSAEPAPAAPAAGPALVTPSTPPEATPQPAAPAPAPAAETAAPAAVAATPDAETSPRGWSLRQWRRFWIPIGGLAGGLTGLLGLMAWQYLERRAFARQRVVERRAR